MAQNQFPVTRRLDSRDFDEVFHNTGFRVSEAALLVLAKANREGFNRLGIVIGKKNVPGAVTRNTIKRTIRETFRALTELDTGLDIVVLVRHKARDMDKCSMRNTLTRAFDKLYAKVEREANGEQPRDMSQKT